MKNELIINGTTEINGKEIKVIEGGFGEGCKILTLMCEILPSSKVEDG